MGCSPHDLRRLERQKWSTHTGTKENSESDTVEEVQDNEGKSKALHETFFPNPSCADETDITDNYQYPAEAFPFEEVTDDHIIHALQKLKPYKAPGPNGIPNVVLKSCTESLLPYLGPLFRATFSLEVYPDTWKQSTTVVLRKPGRPDYTVAKAYCPIALMDTITKTLSSCITDILTYHAENLCLLPNTHFGGRPGRSTTDAIQLMTSFIHQNWEKGNVVSVLFLDMKAAFPSVLVKRLLHNLRRRWIPKQYVDWIERKMGGRTTLLKFDDFVSAVFDIANGCDQGCPLSVFCYLFYNADLIDIHKPKSKELVLAFMDDVNIVKAAKTFQKANKGLNNMMTREGGAQTWSKTHSSTFEMDKLKLVCFSRKCKRHVTPTAKTRPLQRPNLHLGDIVIKPVTSHRYLGVILDRSLRYHEHLAHAEAKATKYALQMRRLMKINHGISL